MSRKVAKSFWNQSQTCQEHRHRKLPSAQPAQYAQHHPSSQKEGVPLACAHARDHSRSVYVPAYYLLVYASSFAYFLFL